MFILNLDFSKTGRTWEGNFTKTGQNFPKFTRTLVGGLGLDRKRGYKVILIRHLVFDHGGRC